MLRLSYRPFLATVLVAGAAVPAAASAATTGPPQPNFVTAFAYSQGAPNASPPGANDWSCKPSAAHPRAVVLVHGTFENRYDNWAYVSPKLKAAGYCVFALDYGVDRTNVVGQDPAVKGTGDMYASAKELSAFVDKVLAATGTAQVDMVGHSQGGLLPRVYLKYDGGANRADPSKNKVRRLITFGATSHGTTLSGVATLAAQLKLLGGGQILLGRAAIQQTKAEDFTTKLNAGGETYPGIGYTVVGTKYDEISTPYRDTFLTAGKGASVNNITVQDGCEVDAVDHLSMTYDPRGLQIILNALDPSKAKPLPCVPNTPLFTLSTLAPTTPGTVTPTTTPAAGGNAVPSTPVSATTPVVPTTPANTPSTTVKVGVKLPGVASVAVTLPVLVPKR